QTRSSRADRAARLRVRRDIRPLRRDRSVEPVRFAAPRAGRGAFGADRLRLPGGKLRYLRDPTPLRRRALPASTQRADRGRRNPAVHSRAGRAAHSRCLSTHSAESTPREDDAVAVEITALDDHVAGQSATEGWVWPVHNRRRAGAAPVDDLFGNDVVATALAAHVG